MTSRIQACGTRTPAGTGLRPSVAAGLRGDLRHRRDRLKKALLAHSRIGSRQRTGTASTGSRLTVDRPAWRRRTYQRSTARIPRFGTLPSAERENANRAARAGSLKRQHPRIEPDRGDPVVFSRCRAVPNRGELQGDIMLSGVPYLQVINDVTVPGRAVGIHFEPASPRRTSLPPRRSPSPPSRHHRCSGAVPAISPSCWGTRRPAHPTPRPRRCEPLSGSKRSSTRFRFPSSRRASRASSRSRPRPVKGPSPKSSLLRRPGSARRAPSRSARQLQYAQQVFLNFNGLTRPHVSVATLGKDSSSAAFSVAVPVMETYQSQHGAWPLPCRCTGRKSAC